jgi:hypothetical protein
VPNEVERIVVIRRFEDGDEDYDEGAGYVIYTTQQTVTLSINNSALCCESWGYFLTEDDTGKFIGAEFRGCRVTRTNRSQISFEKEGDRSIRPDKGEPVKEIHLDCGDVMFVDILTDRGTLQFVAYNSHNGYYGHAVKVVSRELIEEKYL